MHKQSRKLLLNGTPFSCDGEPTLSGVVASYGAPSERVALLLNGHVVPRPSWDETPVNDGDRIEIITMAAGG